ncbi:amidase family protein [Oceanithermus sp.]|uniref:amidase n=1 Tax=Oceanithermus sp. TaxID=2268145 RepID=UPI00257AC453|nr:amidase family protein [Oceanithermus sp.]
METASELTRDYAHGEASPVEVAERVLAELEPGPVVAALTPERALAAARESAARYAAGRARGPLDGVPVLVKDLLDLRGTVTGAGSAVLARLRSPARGDAAAVRNLERAGAVIVGKSQLNELAFSGLGLNPHFGTPPNALDPERVPGGSSSGSAVAVARGRVPLAVGTDTGGSVRIPAAFNGLVGFKPSWGRIPTRGVTPLAVSLDTVGPLARSVEDAWSLFLGLAGEPLRPLPAAPARPRLLVPADLLTRARPEVAEPFERALARLEAAGARLERRPLPGLAEVYALYRRYGALAAHEAFAYWRDLIAEHGAEMDPRVVRRVLAVAERPGVHHAQLRRERARRVPAFWGGLRGTDALVLPTAPVPPPLLAEVEASEEAFFRANDRVLAYTMLFNFYGGPAVSLPLAPGVGLMLAAAPGRDPALFALAAWAAAA